MELKYSWGTVLVDEKYCDVVTAERWYLHTDGKRCYAASILGGKTTYMHRLICGVVDAGRLVVVDHINGNGLDNRRVNLRVCSQSQNCANAKRTRGKSRFKGVFKREYGTWQAYIKVDYVKQHLGHYQSEEDAALAYNRAAVELRGEFAALNSVIDDGRVLERTRRPRK